MPTKGQKKQPAGGAPAAGSKSAAQPRPGERELIVIASPSAGMRASANAVASVVGADVSGLAGLLAAEGVSLTPLFGASEERVLHSASLVPGAAGAELASYYRVHAEDGRLDALARKFAQQPQVEAAYVKPAAEPAVYLRAAAPLAGDAPPVTPDFTARQLYLEAAPGGIDARFAWTLAGGAGAGVRIIDVEGAWRFSHEDLTQNQGGVVGGTQSTDIGWRNHGTAVVGTFGGDRNTFGITGIAPDANTRAISIFGTGSSSSQAIRAAANLLGAGDIILIELHRPGPRNAFANRPDQLGYIAVEWWPDDFAAIRFATAKGVIVVEAGGNGAQNLDDAIYNTRPPGFPATWVNPFRRSPDSGAIIVGAGAPPPGTHGRNHGADRSRLDFSNFGSCVDVQGWGREVTTCGYGDLQGGANEDLWYTDVFSGTSSASPVVVGAVAALQGGLRAKAKPLLTPATARNILRTTGSPQQDEPGRPATQRIGNRPNLRQAAQQLGLFFPKPIHKEIVKEGKEIGKELKDHRKETAKEIVKENKEIAKELKEQRKEFKEIKEGKEVKEGKEFKERVKEVKELRKEHKDGKEFKEKDKDLVEHGGGRFDGGGGPEAALEERLAGLEQAIQQLAHFISPELRPDLAASALTQESDLQALSAQLQQQAQEAKDQKDQKDVEKLAEL